jgi:hypothetical protein
MKQITTAGLALVLAATAPLSGGRDRAQQAPATSGTVLESSAEARFQLDLHVPDRALLSFLPRNWTPNVAAQGAAQDCNLRLVFIDRLTISGPNGRPLGLGANRLAYLVAPVKDPSGNGAQLVIGGLTADPADVPGPFDVYKLATTHTMRRTSTDLGSAAILDSQDWVLEAASGEHLEVHLTYERGSGNKTNPAETKFYSGKDPAIVQVSRQEQVLEILRNVTTAPTDRVRSFSLRASGGSYAPLFDGTERVLSWDNIPWMMRSIVAQTPSGITSHRPATAFISGPGWTP